MTRDVPTITKRERRDIAYLSIGWSPLEPVSRYRINAAVPSMPGIWELYFLERSRIPRLLKMGAAWRGGLRHRLRSEADPEAPANATIRELLESGDCYYRYTICEVRGDLIDAYVVLASIRGVETPTVEETGRYREVRIREPEEMTIHRVRTPSEEQRPAEPFGTRVPNMFDVVREMRAVAAEAEASSTDDEESSDTESLATAPSSDTESLAADTPDASPSSPEKPDDRP
ncbi:MAG: hypothetical protein ACLFSV_09880 [Alkalispirochaeta sp.]